jgi:hypothetical protein
MHLSGMLRDLRRYDEATKELQACEEFFVKQQGDAGSTTRLVRIRLASIALCQGQEAESRRLLERALDPAPGEVAGWLPGRSQTEFGEALLRADRLDEAAPYLRRGYDQLLAAEGAKAGNTRVRGAAAGQAVREAGRCRRGREVAREAELTAQGGPRDRHDTARRTRRRPHASAGPGRG